MRTYQTEGPVRGNCGHNHRTVATAGQCFNADHAGCKSQGGYTDRKLVATEDGERVEVADDEYDEWLEATD